MIITFSDQLRNNVNRSNSEDRENFSSIPSQAYSRKEYLISNVSHSNPFQTQVCAYSMLIDS